MTAPLVERDVISPTEYEVVVAGVLRWTPGTAHRVADTLATDPETDADWALAFELWDAAKEPDRCSCGGFVAGIDGLCDPCREAADAILGGA